MRINRKFLVAAGAAVLVAVGTGVAVASGGSDAREGPDVPVTGDALRKASDAALAATGGGRVTGTEVGDEESYYEVEVTLDDGSRVDVQLDEDLAVVGSAADEEDGGAGG
ncbi:PepSY domain-containing protein [Geodermatophilus sp. URMC 64]